MLLNELVLKTNLTQQELAKQIGINNSTLSKVLNAKESPSKIFRIKVKNYFKCEVEYLTPFDIIKEKDMEIAKLRLAYSKLFDVTCELNLQVCEYRELVNNIKSSIGAQLDVTETYNMDNLKLGNINKEIK